MAKIPHLNLILIFCLGFLFLMGCSKSDDQREFENESLQEPSGITESPSEGNITNEDPDDWRISPMYQGLVNIGAGLQSLEPPYPNPMDYNQDLNINIYLSNNIDNLDRIEVYAFEFSSDAGKAPISVRDDVSSPSLVSLRLNGQQISGKSGGSQANGLYRIRILDGDLNVITYGDIRIGTN